MLLIIGILAAILNRTVKLCVVAQSSNDLGDVNISALLTSFQNGYDKRVRPKYGGPPVTVGVTMYILSISSVSEVMMDFTVEMYFRQFWQDPRLSFTSRPGLEKLVVGADYIQLIWVPDTFFVNEKTAYFHIATTENQFLRILHTGEILRSMRLTIKASCPMNLQFFPMDRQLCYIEIESFGYTMNDIRYKWNDGSYSLQISSDVSLPQFKLLGYRQKTIEASMSTGNYSRLACEIQFVRSMGYYIMQIYIPSSLIVVISWVSFWLSRGTPSARVGLGVTTVLTMTTLITSTNEALPKVSYIKSIDVYLGFCFVMVFASLIQYASVGYIAKRIQMRRNRVLLRRVGMVKLATLAGKYKKEVTNASNAALTNGRPDEYGIPKQTAAHLKFHDLKEHGKGSSREIKINVYNQSGSSGSKYRMSSLPQPMSRIYDKPSPPPPHMQGPPPGHHSISSSPPTRFSPCLPPQELLPLTPGPKYAVKNLNKIYGMTASDIDKYSRIIFPVTFTCFHLMYWILIQHLTDDIVDDLVYLHADKYTF